MQPIHGHYDGKVVVLDEPVELTPEARVLVLFRQNVESVRATAGSARKRLRGSGSGLKLVEKLLAERKKDGSKER